jgi:hypothetical protein
MLDEDQSYFVRRANEEQSAAQRATCPKAAAAHRELAERYTALFETMTDQAKALSA